RLSVISYSMIRRLPTSTLFPYTTLFRSDRLGKVQVVVVHDEAERVAACAAAEAVVELLVGADAERRGLFLVERAAGRVVLAGLFQLDTRTHHLDDVGAVEQIVNEGLRYQAGHKGMRIRSRSMARK